MSSSRASEYQWHVMLLKQKKKKVRRPLIVMGVVWAFLLLFMYILHKNDSAFIQSTHAEKIDFGNLTPGWAEAHPYAQIERGCFSGVHVTEGLIQDKKRYFLMEPCDPLDTTLVRVVVVTETQLSPDVDEYGNASAHFRTGQITYGLEGRERLKWFLRDSWELDHSQQIFTLAIDHTPQSVLKKDAILMVFFLTVGIFTIGFGLLYRKRAIAARDAWRQIFRDKFPEMNI